MNAQPHPTTPGPSQTPDDRLRFKDLAPIVISAIALVLSGLALVKPAQQWVSDYLGSFVSNRTDIPIPPLTLSVETSGYRSDDDGDIWSGDNLLDEDPKTAWSECGTRDQARRKLERRNPCDEPRQTGTNLEQQCGDPESASDDVVQGVGEWVEFQLPAETDLKAVYIRNGFQKSDQLFLRNPRVALLSVDADGEFVRDIPLKDEQGPQRFKLETRGSKIRFTIRKTYLGQCITPKGGETLPYFYDASLAEVALIPETVPYTGPVELARQVNESLVAPSNDPAAQQRR